MAEVTAAVKPRRKVPVIWLVPIVAAAIGVWMVVYNFMTEGPTITITFATAEGVSPGKTKIKARDVELGTVDTVELSEDLQRVVMTAKLERFALPLLREDTQFWVVRPRVGPGGVSGLGTILSGGYIKLSPGKGKTGRRKFEGLENPPVTPAGTPGLELTLTSAQAGSVGTGDPVLYRGYRVGQVENTSFDARDQRVTYRVFIDEPYETLVTANTRFWNASGISLKASANGLELEVGSLQSLLVGGVSFDLPTDTKPGKPAQDGDRFTLYPNHDAIDRQEYKHYVEYVVSFKQSVRGVVPGAPVQYRGIPIGRVERILIEELTQRRLAATGAPIPILLRLEPARLGAPDTAEGTDALRAGIELAVANGLRATLQTGNLLTGSVLVAMDFYPQESPAPMASFAGYPEIPSLSGGLAGLEQQVSQLLKKLNALPLEPAVRDLNATLVSLRDTVETVRTAVTGEEAREMTASIQSALAQLNATLESISPDSPVGDRLDRSLSDLNQTLRNLEDLTRSLADKPNRLIFSPPVTADPEPKQGTSP